MSRKEELGAIINRLREHITKALIDLCYTFHIDNLNNQQKLLHRLNDDLNKYLEEYKSLNN